MAEDVGVDWVIEAMRKIRQRKQRRTVDRIIYAIRRKYRDVSVAEIDSFLDRAEKRGLIKKHLDDKNLCSYKECKIFKQKQANKLVVQDLLSQVVISVIKDSYSPCTTISLMKCVHDLNLFDTLDEINWKQQVRYTVRRLVKDGLVEQVGETLRLRAGVGETLVNNSHALMTSVAGECSVNISFDCDENTIITSNTDSTHDHCVSSSSQHCLPQRVTVDKIMSNKCRYDSSKFIDGRFDQIYVGKCSADIDRNVQHLNGELQCFALGIETENAVLLKRKYSKVIESEGDIDTPRRRSLRGTPVKDNKPVCPTMLNLSDCQRPESDCLNSEREQSSKQKAIVTSSKGTEVLLTASSNHNCSDITGSLQSISRVIETSNIILEDHSIINNGAGSEVMNCSQLIRDIVSCTVHDHTTNNNSNVGKNKVILVFLYSFFKCLCYCNLCNSL